MLNANPAITDEARICPNLLLRPESIRTRRTSARLKVATPRLCRTTRVSSVSCSTVPRRLPPRVNSLISTRSPGPKPWTGAQAAACANSARGDTREMKQIASKGLIELALRALSLPNLVPPNASWWERHRNARARSRRSLTNYTRARGKMAAFFHGKAGTGLLSGGLTPAMPVHMTSACAHRRQSPRSPAARAAAEPAARSLESSPFPRTSPGTRARRSRM